MSSTRGGQAMQITQCFLAFVDARCGRVLLYIRRTYEPY